MSSLYLSKGKDYDNVNKLIITLLDIIEENLSEKENYNNIDDLIILLSDIMEDFGEIYKGANYGSFVIKYSKEFNNKVKDKKLEKICLFFRGLNQLNFEQAFKEIKNFYNTDYYANIEKYYIQMNYGTKKEVSQYMSEKSYEEVNPNEDIEKKSTEFSDNAKYNNNHYEKQFDENIDNIEKNINENIINEDKKSEIKEIIKEKYTEEQYQEFVKKKNEKNIGTIQKENNSNIKNEKEINIKKEGIKNNGKFQKKDKVSENNKQLFLNDINITITEMHKQLILLQKELKETKKKQQESEIRSQEDFEKYKKKANKELMKYRNEFKKENDELKQKIFSLNIEFKKLKDELICIKMRDISNFYNQ